MKHETELVIDDATLALLLSTLANMPEPELSILPIRVVHRERIFPPKWEAPPLTDEDCAALLEALRKDPRE